MQATLDFANPAKAPLSLTNDVSTYSDRLILAHQLITEIKKHRVYKNRKGATKYKFSHSEWQIIMLPYDRHIPIQKIWELQEFLLELQRGK